jgi:hypothetical protein
VGRLLAGGELRSKFADLVRIKSYSYVVQRVVVVTRALASPGSSGWSNEGQQMRLGAVFSEAAANLDQDGKGAQVIRPEAWTLQEFEGEQLLTQPPIGAQLWVEAMGGPVYDLAQIWDIDEFASNLLAAQRTIGNPHRGVGAFGQITRVTKTECATRIFERYDDEIGEVMVPLEFDWKARRAERAPAIPEGLGRLQRERMEKKARKGALRTGRG